MSYADGKTQTLLALLLGQVVSFCLAVSSYSVSIITSKGVDAPLGLSFFTYFALALVYGATLLYKRQKLKISWYWYMLISFVDLVGVYFGNKAFEFTSITSVTVLDFWTIVWVILLTWLVFGTKYSLWQFFGAAVCIGGLSLVIFSDSKSSSFGDGSNPLLGDALVVAGTIFLALGNVAMEFCVKKKDRTELLAMMGLFSLLISALGIATMEKKNIESIKWSPALVLAYAGCTTASFAFYTLSSFVLKMGGSTLYNLSLLTSDMWAVVIRLFLLKQKVNWLYYPSFILVAIGIFIYTKMKKNHDDIEDDVPEDSSVNKGEYQLLDEENVLTKGTLS